ncbi:MAG: 3-isopropylmalate dehydratase large subunit [Thalassobaculum sp.]|uniref:3-isopropylmalate dehydratase large subunit n=1 Tax=Thalassobaculum sp. TaxID=2022740 RepID=UPI0032ED7EE5
MTSPTTLFEKIWRQHRIVERDDGQALLWIDRHLCHEGSFHAFDKLARSGRKVRRPDLTFAVADHYVPTRDRAAGARDPEIATMIRLLGQNAAANGVRLFGLDDPDQGIVHVVAPELGLTQPGITLVCGDSHTSTHGAFGALAFGIGASEVAHVLATQALWQKRPRTLRITVDGRLGAHVTAKDLILAVIARIGADGAAGHVVEYAGEAIRALSMEARMTVCNMTIEAGGRAGMIAPDDTTYDWLHGRRHAPQGADWDAAVADWRSLASDPGAAFDREVALDAAAVAPTVTWGTSPEHALPVTATVPDPAAEPDAGRRATLEAALAYMDLAPGTPLSGIAVDRVFIGSCTNARLGDLRAAAAVLKDRRAAVPLMVVPGSSAVKRAAEAEGLDRVFTAAGAEWLDSGCSMCAATNGDMVAPGQRCASTTNRNFRGRQGPGARTHLMSPAMAAAAAVTGRLTDVRELA